MRPAALLLIVLSLLAAGPGSNAPAQAAPLKISATSGGSTGATLAVLGTVLMAFWIDDTGGDREIYAARSTSSGATFGAGVNLSANAGHSDCYTWTVVGPFIYVLWRDITTGNGDVYYRRSTNVGGSFLGTVNLSNNSTPSGCPAVGHSGGGNMYVVWADTVSGNREILLRRSVDGGATWQAAQNLSSTAGTSDAPVIIATGPNVYVAWQEGSAPSREIRLRRSKDGGATWQPFVNVSATPADSITPRLVLAGSDLYAAYADRTPGNYDIYFRRSGDAGQTFGAAVNVSASASDSADPRLGVSSVNVLITWRENVGGQPDLFLRRSGTSGASFLATQNLTGTGTQSLAYIAGLAGRELHLVWEEKTSTTNWDVFYRKSTTLGASFGPSVNLSANASNSRRPYAVVRGLDVYVVWDDNATGNAEIYFLRSTIGGF